MRPNRILVLATGLAAAGALGPGLVAALQERDLIALTPDEGSSYGLVAAVDGDLAAVVSPFEDSGNSVVYVFEKAEGIWPQQAALQATTGNVWSFDAPMALRGGTVAVGTARLSGNQILGSVEVFTKSGAWGLPVEVSRPLLTFDDDFGTAIAISEDESTLVVGGGRQGVEVFVRNGAAWDFQARLEPVVFPNTGIFGARVAVSGDTAVVGSEYDGNFGSAYVFVRSGQPPVWTEVHKFQDSGAIVALAAGPAPSLTLVCGEPDDATNGESSGAARVFVGSGSTWSAATPLVQPDPEAYDQFGAAVAVSGDSIVVGAPHGFDSADTAGEVFRFIRANGVWGPAERIFPASGSGRFAFGRSVGVSGEFVVVGSGDEDQPNAPGTAMIFGGSAGGGGGGGNGPVAKSPLRPSSNPGPSGSPLVLEILPPLIAGNAKPAPAWHWDFGDGTTLDAGTKVTKTYSAPGDYDVNVNALTDANDKKTLKVRVVAPGTPYFDVAKASTSLKFTQQGKDKIAVSGQIPVPDGTSLEGRELDVTFGGVHFEIDLAKGKGKSGNASAKVSAPKGGVAKFTLKAKGAFATQLADEGMTNADVVSANATTKVDVQLLADVHTEDFVLVYDGRAGKKGAAK